jgi:hypothetical protein
MDEDRTLQYENVTEGRKTIAIVSAEIKWTEELEKRELIVP